MQDCPVRGSVVRFVVVAGGPGMKKDVLLGILAAQLGFVSPADVMAAVTKGGDGESLGERLVARGRLSRERLAKLHDLAEEMVRVHGGSLEGALASVGGNKAVRQTFGAVAKVVKPQDDTVLADPNALDFYHNFENVTEEQVGRYTYRGGKDKAEVGRGGIGRVLMAYDEHLGREIAVKELLNPHGALDASEFASTQWEEQRGSVTTARVARFLREARVTGQLEHPSIVPVYEVGRRDSGALYYTMKLVRGRTFEDALDACGSLRERLKLLPHYLDLCQAIAYAHSRRVIHRDIKPKNVMLGEFGETVVLDWGLAKVKGTHDLRGDDLQSEIKLYRDAAAGATVDGTAVGTPGYMSPEQAQGQVEHVDEQSDVWSLGAVLYEMLTGHAPFEGTFAFEVIDKVISEEVVPPSAVDSMIPPDLSSVCIKALTKDRTKRYARAADLANDVSAYMEGRRVSVYEYGAWELVRRLVKRHKAISALVLAVVIAVLTGTIGVSIAYREAEVNRRRAVAQGREAELSRQNEEKARIDAQRNERQAHLNLAVAYGEEAGRLMSARNFLGAGVFAAAALVHNPNNQLGPFRFPEGEEAADGDPEQLSLMHSNIFSAAVNRLVSADTMLDAHASAVLEIDFSRDGTSMVTAGGDGAVKLWSVPERKVISELGRHTGAADSATFSPDGRWLASGGTDAEVRIYSVAERKAAGPVLRHAQRVRSVAFTPDGNKLLAGSGDGRVHVWSVPDGNLLGAMVGHAGQVWAVAVSSDGKVAASAAEDKTVRLWDMETMQEIAVLTGHTGMVFAVQFSPTLPLLASAGFDGTVRLWKLPVGEPAGVLRGHDGHVISLSFSLDGKLLASGGHDRRVCLWSVPEGHLEAAFFAHDSYVWALEFSPDSRLLATGDNAGKLGLWSLHARKESSIQTDHEDSIFQIAYSPDGKLLATSSFDKTVRLHQLDGRGPATVLKGHERFAWALRFSPDGTLLASGGSDSKLKLWSVPRRVEVSTLTGHQDIVGAVAFSPDGGVLASAGADGIRLWSVAQKSESAKYTTTSTVWALEFSPDGTMLLAGDDLGRVRVYDAQSMVSLRDMEGHSGKVSALAFSPDGKLMISCGKDATLRVWDTATWTHRILTGHKQWVNTAAISADGTLALSGSDDNTVRVWNIADGKMLYVGRMSKEVTGVVFDPSGTSVAVAEGTVVHVLPVLFDSWQTDPVEMLKHAEADAGMQLTGFSLQVSKQ